MLIGRAYLWGLAANGQAGVQNVLDVLRNGIDSTLLALGHGSVHDLGRGDVVLPPGFRAVASAPCRRVGPTASDRAHPPRPRRRRRSSTWFRPGYHVTDVVARTGW